MKTTIEISHADIIASCGKAQIINRGVREKHSVDIRLNYSNGNYLTQFSAHEIDLTDIDGPHVYQYVTDGSADSIADCLTETGITYKVFRDAVIKLIKVKITDLLDTHWMLYQMIDTPKLRITSAAGVEHYLDYVNDGDGALCATFDCTGHNAADGMALVDALAEQATKYEVQ